MHRRHDLTGRLADLGRSGVWPSIDGEHLEAHLERLGLVAHARIGSATVRVIRTRQLVDRGMALLRDRPEHWFSAPFLAWRRDAVGP